LWYEADFSLTPHVHRKKSYLEGVTTVGAIHVSTMDGRITVNPEIRATL
jgi:hypothetical protein